MICTFLMHIFFLHKTPVEFPETKESPFYFIRMNELVSHLKLATYGIQSVFTQYQSTYLKNKCIPQKQPPEMLSVVWKKKKKGHIYRVKI